MKVAAVLLAQRVEQIDGDPPIGRDNGEDVHGGTCPKDWELEFSPLKYQAGDKQEDSGIENSIGCD